MSNTALSTFMLYTTLGCHLCDDAEALLQPLFKHLNLVYSKKDIADNDSLVDLYGIRIPVLQHIPTGAELGWPFDSEVLQQFLILQCQLV